MPRTHEASGAESPWAHRRRPHLAPILGALVVGGATGALMVWVQRLVILTVLRRVAEAPLPLLAASPFIGLVLTWACLRFLARAATPTVADEYIRNVHDPEPLDLRPAPGRLLASMTTIGLGAALGLEGVAVYVGGALGTLTERAFGRRLRTEDTKMLMIAGAAAGVAAIFQTPVTGAVFALEVPFRGRLSRRHVAPILAGSLAGYVAAILIVGRRPLFPVRGHLSLDGPDLIAALAIGILAGALANGFARLVVLSNTAVRRVPATVRLPIAGAAIAAVILIAARTTDVAVVLGPGYDATRWALDPTHAAGLVLGVLAMRVVATTAALGGGGVGGLSIPLVSLGALTGRFASGIAGRAGDPLDSVVGAAAFLAAGYRVPLAGITFVAETTGRVGFIVPAMVAVFAADLVTGRASVSTEQRDDAEAGW